MYKDQEEPRTSGVIEAARGQTEEPLAGILGRFERVHERACLGVVSMNVVLPVGELAPLQLRPDHTGVSLNVRQQPQIAERNRGKRTVSPSARPAKNWSSLRMAEPCGGSVLAL